MRMQRSLRTRPSDELQYEELQYNMGLVREFCLVYDCVRVWVRFVVRGFEATG